MNDENRTARATLTSLFEPGDIVGRALVAKHGAPAALRVAIGASRRTGTGSTGHRKRRGR